MCRTKHSADYNRTSQYYINPRGLIVNDDSSSAWWLKDLTFPIRLIVCLFDKVLNVTLVKICIRLDSCFSIEYVAKLRSLHNVHTEMYRKCCLEITLSAPQGWNYNTLYMQNKHTITFLHFISIVQRFRLKHMLRSPVCKRMQWFSDKTSSNKTITVMGFPPSWLNKSNFDRHTLGARLLWTASVGPCSSNLSVGIGNQEVVEHLTMDWHVR